MGTLYSGVAASLATGVQITVPADGDPDNAATFDVGMQKLADVAEALRTRATFTGATPNGAGVTGTGTGSGAGVVGNSSGSVGSNGVSGVATATGLFGVIGTGAGAGSAGVRGVGTGSAPGVSGAGSGSGGGPGGSFAADPASAAPAIDLTASNARGAIHFNTNAA
jgi:hypothetical protein